MAASMSAPHAHPLPRHSPSHGLSQAQTQLPTHPHINLNPYPEQQLQQVPQQVPPPPQKQQHGPAPGRGPAPEASPGSGTVFDPSVMAVLRAAPSAPLTTPNHMSGATSQMTSLPDRWAAPPPPQTILSRAPPTILTAMASGGVLPPGAQPSVASQPALQSQPMNMLYNNMPSQPMSQPQPQYRAPHGAVPYAAFQPPTHSELTRNHNGSNGAPVNAPTTSAFFASFLP